MATAWKNVVGEVASCLKLGSRNGGFEIVFTYKVEGHWYGGTFWSLSPRSGFIDLKYDPENPERNSLVRRERIKNIVVYSIVALVVTGLIAWRLLDGP